MKLWVFVSSCCFRRMSGCCYLLWLWVVWVKLFVWCMAIVCYLMIPIYYLNTIYSFLIPNTLHACSPNISNTSAPISPHCPRLSFNTFTIDSTPTWNDIDVLLLVPAPSTSLQYFSYAFLLNLSLLIVYSILDSESEIDSISKCAKFYAEPAVCLALYTDTDAEVDDCNLVFDWSMDVLEGCCIFFILFW